jgi:hypothetical protein
MTSRIARNQAAQRAKSTVGAVPEKRKPFDSWFPLQLDIKQVLGDNYTFYEECITNIVKIGARKEDVSPWSVKENCRADWILTTRRLDQIQPILDVFPDARYSHAGMLLLLEEMGVMLPRTDGHLRNPAPQLHEQTRPDEIASPAENSNVARVKYPMEPPPLPARIANKHRSDLQSLSPGPAPIANMRRSGHPTFSPRRVIIAKNVHRSGQPPPSPEPAPIANMHRSGHSNFGPGRVPITNKHQSVPPPPSLGPARIANMQPSVLSPPSPRPARIANMQPSVPPPPSPRLAYIVKTNGIWSGQDAYFGPLTVDLAGQPTPSPELVCTTNVHRFEPPPLSPGPAIIANMNRPIALLLPVSPNPVPPNTPVDPPIQYQGLRQDGPLFTDPEFHSHVRKFFAGDPPPTSRNSRKSRPRGPDP